MGTRLKSNQLCTIYLARHGQTDWNVKRKIQGHQDISLNKQGKLQAYQLAKKLGKIKFSAIYSSDLARAKQTAEIIALNHSLAVSTNKFLRERTFGKYEGCKVEKFRRLFQDFFEDYYQLSDQEQLDHLMPYDNQSWNQVLSKTITLLREIALAYPNKTVLVVSHGGVIRHLLIKMGFFTSSQIPWGSMGNASYTKLKSDGIDFFLEKVNGIDIHES